MKSLRSFLTPKSTPDALTVDVRLATQRVLIEYILNMAVTCLADGDLAPLYDAYRQDPRLAEEDQDELARAYLLLQMSPLRRPDA